MTDVPQPKRPFPRRGTRRDRNQALAIQRKLEATILDPSTPAASVASCAAAWTRVQEAKRIIDGKPLPGQLRPELAQLRAARRSKALLAIDQADLPKAASQ